jgi:8-amino-7-oxononanoate synthase
LGRAALSVKARGWMNLLRAAAGSLRVAVAVGSWAGRFGSAHQAYYSAANALLAALVQAAPRHPRAVAVEFGPWEGSNMVATIPRPLLDAMRADAAVSFVDADEGVRALMEALSTGTGVVTLASRPPPMESSPSGPTPAFAPPAPQMSRVARGGDGRWANESTWAAYQGMRAKFAELDRTIGKNPYFDVHEGVPGATVRVAGRRLLNFSSFNYLALAGDLRIRRAVIDAVDAYGTSTAASRVAGGDTALHRRLESAIATLLDVDGAIVFPGGHATNVTVIGHLFGSRDLILHDALVHDSCLQGARLSGAARRSFRHNDAADLEQELQRTRHQYDRVLILVEGVYSMDGDIAPMDAYADLKNRYDCVLMVDEAHSFGTLGAAGLGVRQHFGLRGEDVDIWMGTLSKALVGVGGWIAGSASLIEYLKYTTPGFVFATGLAPPMAATALAALDILMVEPERTRTLQGNAARLRERLVAAGIDTGLSSGIAPIVPVILGDSRKTMQAAARLIGDGVNVKPVVYPAVAEGAARLRLFLCSDHTPDQIEDAVRAIAAAVSG